MPARWWMSAWPTLSGSFSSTTSPRTPARLRFSIRCGTPEGCRTRPPIAIRVLLHAPAITYVLKAYDGEEVGRALDAEYGLSQRPLRSRRGTCGNGIKSMKTKALTLYRHKRDFSKTAEPRGSGSTAASDRLRFVVQKHAARRLHFDLRLELDRVFKSWAVTRGPSLDPADKRLAVEVEDHPLDYGDFEGTIPEGQYGGGTVQLWDRGYWQPEGAETPEKALAAGELKFRLDGTHLHGGWVLVRMKRDRDRGKRTNWLLIKHRDDAAVADGGKHLSALDRSVASGRSMKQIAAGTGRAPTPFMTQSTRGKRPATVRSARPDAVWSSKAPAVQTGVPVAHIPEFVEPQLAKLVDKPPTAAG